MFLGFCKPFYKPIFGFCYYLCQYVEDLMQCHTNVKLFALQRNCVYEFLQIYKTSTQQEFSMNEESFVH